MLGELLAEATRRQEEQETVMRAVGAAVRKQGGIVTLSFEEMDAVTGGLALEVDGDNKMVILRVMSDEEMEAEQAMADAASEEKH